MPSLSAGKPYELPNTFFHLFMAQISKLDMPTILLLKRLLMKYDAYELDWNTFCNSIPKTLFDSLASVPFVVPKEPAVTFESTQQPTAFPLPTAPVPEKRPMEQTGQPPAKSQKIVDLEAEPEPAMVWLCLTSRLLPGLIFRQTCTIP